jgi:predicted RNase H-like HicB family nuclease
LSISIQVASKEVGMAMAETANVVLRLSAMIRSEAGSWLAGCPSLDLYTQGDTEEEAKANLQEAVELWIDSCIERNTLGRALRELGWFRILRGIESPSSCAPFLP